MKKVVIALIVVLAFTQALFAGGSKDNQQKIILRWGTVVADGNVTVDMMRRTAEEINSKTNGRVEVQVFSNGVLGSGRDLVEGVQSGIVDMTIEGPGYLAPYVPAASILDAPFIYRDVDHMLKVFRSPFMDRIKDEMLKKNVRILGEIYYGTRHVTTGKVPVYSVKDVGGLKFRVPENRSYMEMVNSWGARPTPVSLAELYLSLQSGIVDGQENPLSTIEAQKFYEVQKYVVLTSHIIAVTIIIVNENSWKRISPEDQKIIQTAMNNGMEWNNAEMIRREGYLVDELKAKGMEFITPDRESFRTVTGPYMLERFEAEWGKGSWDEIQNVK